jgi:putative copper export protein
MEQTAATTAAKFGEYGLVGLLMFVIVVVMALLLRYTLAEAQKDKDRHAEQTERFTFAVEKMSAVMVSVEQSMRALSGKVDDLSKEVIGLRSHR